MRTPQRGMTILEVLIATMMLAVVALVIFSAFGVGLRAAALASRMNTATGLAEEALTQLTASTCGSSFSPGAVSEPSGEGLARFHREVAARARGASGLWELTSTVTWTQERRERSVTLTTLRYTSVACEFVGR
jgi:prepilin-type N-terminal cleavage/methylation domain-containing protein